MQFILQSSVFFKRKSLRGAQWLERVVEKFNYYRKRRSASYIVREVRSVREREREIQREREREREIDGSDVIIVALKLAMSLHFPMPKIRTIAVSSHFPLPKIRTFRSSLHTSCLSSFLKWSPLWR